jgi:small subunit ribosomal protein S16
MLTIRLARVGRKNKAQFQIVLQEHTVAPGGRHVEVLGSHDPHQKKTTLKTERIQYWLGQGAQSSDTAYNLLVANKLIAGDKRKVKLFKKVDPEAEKAAAEAAEKAAADAAAAKEAEATAKTEEVVAEKAPEATEAK